MPSSVSGATATSGRSAPSFEEALAELQEVVTRLESGALTLEETIATFRQGTELASQCQRMIADAELRITELTNESSVDNPSDHSFTEVPF